VRAIFDHLVAQGRDADGIVDYVSGMTDRFALDYAARLP
jgi:dGTP triphosphohydrolase